MNHPSLQSARNLALFALISISLVSLIYLSMQQRIERQTTNATLTQFRALAPNHPIGAELLDSAQPLTLGKHNVIHYPASANRPIDFFQATTSKGYSGNITLLIAISADKQTLLGARTLSHSETPGLGDKIDTNISPWILNFNQLNIAQTHFAVDKDGGEFDSFTGATITPRAVTTLIGTIAHSWQTHTEPSHDPQP